MPDRLSRISVNLIGAVVKCKLIVLVIAARRPQAPLRFSLASFALTHITTGSRKTPRHNVSPILLDDSYPLRVYESKTCILIIIKNNMHYDFCTCKHRNVNMQFLNRIVHNSRDVEPGIIKRPMESEEHRDRSAIHNACHRTFDQRRAREIVRVFCCT